MRDIKSIKKEINAKATELSELYREMAISQDMPIGSVDTVPYGGAIVFHFDQDQMYDVDMDHMEEINNALRKFGIYCIWVDSNIQPGLLQSKQELAGYLRHILQDIDPECQFKNTDDAQVSEWVPYSPLTDTYVCKNCDYGVPSLGLTTPYCPWCGFEMKNYYTISTDEEE